MERLNIYTSFDKEKIEAFFSVLKNNFSKAKLEWYKADLPLTVGISAPDSCKNRAASDKISANCVIIKIAGKDAFFIAGKSFVAMTFFYRENFSEQDAAKIDSAIFSPEGVAAQGSLSTEMLLVKHPLLYYAVLISIPILLVAGLVIMIAINPILGLLIISSGVFGMIVPLMKAIKIKRRTQAKS